MSIAYDMDRETSNEPERGPSPLGVFKRVGGGAGAIGFLGIIGLVAGFFMDTDTFFHSYMFGYIYWISLTLGCFAVTVLHGMIRATWSVSILRIMEAGAKTLPVMFALFLPILFGMLIGHHLYHWSNPELVRASAILPRKVWYLNPTGFTIRAIVYFGFWILLSNYLNASTKRQDASLDNAEATKRTRLAAPGFLLLVLSITFAFTDWVMSVDDHWYSTIYGLWFGVCSVLAAASLGTLIVCLLNKRRPYNEIVTTNLLRDLGTILLMLTMLWAYTSLSQFLIIWSGNLPEEITYYVQRFDGPLRFMGAFLIFFQFFGPFFLLLSTRTKRTPILLGGVALWLLFVRIVDIFWTITPYFRDGLSAANLGGYALDAAAWAGIGGVWVFTFCYFIVRSPLLVRHDLRLQESKIQEAVAHHA